MVVNHKPLFEVPEFLRPLLQPRGPDGIYKIEINNERMRGFRFEWHPRVKEVYVIEPGSQTGIQVASGVQDPHQARICTMLWCRGYLFLKQKINEARRDDRDGSWDTYRP